LDPAALGPLCDGGTVHEYVPGLHRHLAACDLAIIQGGLTTAMELTARGRPFMYFPLRRHFEQQIHVPYRLDRYRAGRRMDLADTGREELAAAIVEELARVPDYMPVETDGAERTAKLIAELV
jgi:UDP-N-acetylglucosamine:LPS N-acetylglucosamine transferase